MIYNTGIVGGRHYTCTCIMNKGIGIEMGENNDSNGEKHKQRRLKKNRINNDIFESRSSIFQACNLAKQAC